MANWFEHPNQTLPWWGWLACEFLKCGKIPRHIAIIMDGNRRFARRLHLPSVIDGHACGFDQFSKVLNWCRELGAVEITVYAFSIENFSRPSEEVQGLLELAEEKFENLLKQKSTLDERGICVRFFGNRQLLPRRLQTLMAEIELLTMEHRNVFVNICLAYSSQDEITRAMDMVRRGVRAGLIEKSDINETLLEQCLDTCFSYPVDLLIRTSEQRLSDFMLWQVERGCYVHFETDVLWPEFSFWHLFKAILSYQLNDHHTTFVDDKNKTEANLSTASADEHKQMIWKREMEKFVSDFRARLRVDDHASL